MDDQNQKDNKDMKEAKDAVAEEKKADIAGEDKIVESTAEDKTTEPAAEEEKSPKGKSLGFDDFRVGDTIRVFYKIIEGDKLRTQPYEGIVISKRGEGVSKSFTVRRMGADNVGIERIFPAYSPNIDSIKLMKKGKVRRAKLYYLRSKVGRAAMRVKEIKK